MAQASPGRGASCAQRPKTFASTSSLSDRREAARNDGAKRMRCPSTGPKSASTSSGTTNSRPSRSAKARAERSSASEPLERGAELNDLQVSGGANERHDPALQERMNVHVLHGTLKRTHLGDRHDRADVVERMAAALVQHDLVLVLLTRISERGAEQEPVELRLGQEKGALLLDRVLGREQEERGGEPRA